MFHWFRSRRQPLPSSRTSQRRRPTLEVLEGRLTPSTLTVSNLNDSGPASLRQAILDANSRSGADVIRFAPGLAGTISLQSALPSLSSAIDIEGPGANLLTVQRSTAGGNFPFDFPLLVSDSNLLDDSLLHSLVVDDGGPIVFPSPPSFRVFTITGDATVTLAGLTIANGNDPTDFGGGIYNQAGTLTVTNSIIKDNFGGGIYNAGTLTVSNSTISGNTALYAGGGIFNEFKGHTLTVVNCTITGNKALGQDGGGLLNDAGSTMTVTNSTITGNTSQQGAGGGIANLGNTSITSSVVGGNTANSGGGICNQGVLTVTGSTVDGNTARFGFGGGVENTHGILAIASSTFSHNTGSGIGNAGGTVTLTNCTISGNTAAGGFGGAIDNLDTMTVTNCTVSGNTANSGGGIFNSNTATLTMANTVVAQNSGQASPDVLGAFASQGYNLIGDGTGSSGFTAAGDQLGSSLSPIDPRLGPLQDNGGLTFTHALLFGSPATDAGNPSHSPTTDQRGSSRAADGDGNGSALPDIGAFEADPIEALTVLSVTRANPDPTNATSVSWTVTFSRGVSGVDAGDFTLVQSGVSGAAITSVSPAGPAGVYTVTASTGSGSGTLGLSLVDDDSVLDSANYPLGSPGTGNGNFTGQSYTIDKTAPSVSSVVKADTDPSNAGTVHFTVTFSETVTGVGASDFSLVTGVRGASIASVSGSGATYTVTVKTGTGSGSIGLNLVDNDSIVDAANNPLDGVEPGCGNFTGQVYTIDRTAPTVAHPLARQAVKDNATVSPFTTVTVTDAFPGQTYAVTVKLSNAANGTLSDLSGGSYNPATGVYTLSGQPSAAAIQDALRALVFTPTLNQVAPRRTVTTVFTVQVSDGTQFTTNRATSVVATSVNDAPGGVSRTYSVARNRALAVGTATGVLQGAVDPDRGTVLRAVLVKRPDRGRLVLRANGSFVYTPPRGFVGTVRFDFVIRDNHGRQSSVVHADIQVL